MRQLEQTWLPLILSPWLGWLLLLLVWVPCAIGQTADHGSAKPKSYRDLACDYYNKADYDNCISNCLKAIHQNPRDAWAYDCRAQARGEKGDLEGAIADFRTALRISPTFAGAYADCGWFFLCKKHDLRVALADYNEAIRLDPTNVDDYIGRADVYLEQTNFDQALHDYNTTIQLQPNNAEMFLARARAYLYHDELDKALDDYNTAIQLNPATEEGYNRRGDVLCDMTNYAAAELNYQAFTRSNPTNPATWDSIGYFHERMTNFTSAIADFTQCIQLNPTNASYYVPRADAEEKSAQAFARLGEQKKQDEAMSRALLDLREASKLEPHDLVELGEFECRRGWFDQGIAAFTLWLEAYPTNYGGFTCNGFTDRAFAYEMLGNDLRTSGDVKGQQEALAKALADWNHLAAFSSPDQTYYARLRGDFYARNHQYASALGDYQRAIELQPNNGIILTSFAWFLATCPDPAYRDGTNAVAFAQKACAIYESEKFQRYAKDFSLAALAAALAETGDFTEAVKCQRKVMRDIETFGNYSQKARAEMRDRLTLYEQGQPCHQPLGLDVFFE